MTTTLSEVSYDYSEKFLALANKFFNVSDTSTLKVGMFGYHNDIHSNMMKDSVFHRNMLYNEFFINNASLHSSVYNWAKILNEPVTLNTPARLQASITVNLPALDSSITIKKEANQRGSF